MAKKYVGAKRQKRKKEDGTYVEYGNFRGYHPGLQQIVDLGTRDEAEANRLLISFHGRTGPGVSGMPESNGTIPTSERNSVEAAKVIDFDAAVATETAQSSAQVTSDTLLSDWAKSTAEPASPIVAEPQKSNAAASTPSLLDSIFREPKTNQGPKAKKGQLDPVVAAKTALGLKKVITNLNCYVVGGCVSMFGRVPAQLEPEEVEQLEVAWGLYLEELLGKIQAKPWMFVLLANLSIGVGMYMQGESKKKVLKANGTAEAPRTGPGGMPVNASELPSTPKGYDGKQWSKS